MVESSGDIGLWEDCENHSKSCFYQYKCMDPLIKVDENGDPDPKDNGTHYAMCVKPEECLKVGAKNT